MARSVNQVILMGNLTRDPEVRQTPTGQSLCSFSLALNRAYKDTKTDEWVETTDYVDVVAWGPLGERVGQYLSKGRRCLVQGRLQSRNWEQDGQKRTKVEVLANEVTFLDGRGSGDGDEGGSSYGGGSSSRASSGGSRSAAPAKKQDTVIEDIGDEPINLDDIPF